MFKFLLLLLVSFSSISCDGDQHAHSTTTTTNQDGEVTSVHSGDGGAISGDAIASILQSLGNNQQQKNAAGAAASAARSGGGGGYDYPPAPHPQAVHSGGAIYPGGAFFPGGGFGLGKNFNLNLDAGVGAGGGYFPIIEKVRRVGAKVLPKIIIMNCWMSNFNIFCVEF
jgi:hypothetical protein